MWEEGFYECVVPETANPCIEENAIWMAEAHGPRTPLRGTSFTLFDLEVSDTWENLLNRKLAYRETETPRS